MSPPASPLRILVTGADGQLGRSLRDIPSSPTLQISFADRQTLDIGRMDDIDRWLDTHPTDIIINTAAYTAVDRAEGDPASAMAVNAHAAGYLAEQSTAHGCRLLHISTDYVFDGQQATPYAETDSPAPLNVYGRSKLAGEALVTQLAPDAIVLRTSWVFSPFGSNFFKTMMRLAYERETLNVIDDQVGGPTYAPHIASILLALAQCSREKAPGGIYHYAGQPPVSWHAFAQTIFAEALACGALAVAPTVLPLASSEWPSPAPRPPNSRLSNQKLSTVLGPLTCDWRAGVRDALSRLNQTPPLQ